jgi:hypothetical protein
MPRDGKNLGSRCAQPRSDVITLIRFDHSVMRGAILFASLFPKRIDCRVKLGNDAQC